MRSRLLQLILTFTLVSSITYAWKSEYKDYLNKCSKKSFTKFHLKFSKQVFDNRKRTKEEDMLTHLFFSTHMSPADTDYVHFTACGAHFSAFYYLLDTLKKSEESVIKEWEKCFKNSFNGKISKEYKKNIECAKNALL